MKRLLVAGGGVAGAAGAFSASRRGFDVTWVRGGAGASVLAPGVADLAPWDSAPAEEALGAALTEFVQALGAWVLPARHATVVSAFGVVRRARARDPLVLDLEPLGGGVVGVAGGPGPVDLAGSVADSAWARRTGTRVREVHVDPPCWASSPLEAAGGAAPPLAEELGRLGAAVAASAPPPNAWLLPASWLPDDAVRAGLETALGRPVGCCMGSLATELSERLAGRLEAFEPPGVQRVGGWLRQLERRDGVLVAELVTSSGERTGLATDQVLLCIGGPVAGGIRLNAQGRLELDVALDGVELECWTGGNPRALDAPSAAGIDFTELGHAALRGIGVRAAAGALPPGVHAAGDLRAGVPRTLLAAAQSAIDVVDALGPA